MYGSLKEEKQIYRTRLKERGNKTGVGKGWGKTIRKEKGKKTEGKGLRGKTE